MITGSYFLLIHSACTTKSAGLYNLFKIQAKDDIHCPPLTIMEHPSIIGDELAWLFSAMHDSSKVICSYSYQLRSHSVPHRDVFCFPSDPEIERKVSLSQLAPPLCHDLLRINTAQSVYRETTEVINSPIYSDFLKNVALQIWPHYNTLCLVSTTNCLILLRAGGLLTNIFVSKWCSCEC